MDAPGLPFSPWIILPFVVLLAAIALGPVLLAHWWERHYAKVSLLLATITLGYYVFGLQAFAQIGHTAHEYVSFILLVGSLFVVSGGIHINVKGEATPALNTLFLFVGALLANVLGTTGAAMLLIRPWIRLNRYRITAHHIVFFIFLVANIGGGLTPIGDPPLFLGYLRGIPFWWVARHVWPMWALVTATVLAIFYGLDSYNYRKAPRPVRTELTHQDQWRFEGLGNLGFLGVILAAVFLHHPPFLREALLLGAALGSYFTTAKTLHQANHFSFHPIREVAILFAGIFATMMPALDWLQAHARDLHQPSAALFYWGCGTLSSLLDNAPTYLSFLSAAQGLFADASLITQIQTLAATPGADLTALQGPQAELIRHTLAALHQAHPQGLSGLRPEEIATTCLLANAALTRYVTAISVAAVFFGACTYIGNGPNFMVKSIAEQAKVRTPSFLSYLLFYALPCLGPILAAIGLLFFH